MGKLTIFILILFLFGCSEDSDWNANGIANPYLLTPEEVAASINRSCGYYGRGAGLVTNYRLSEGEDKTLEDFYVWVDAEVKASDRFLVKRIAVWVWNQDMVHPVLAYFLYKNECLERSIAQLPPGYFDGLTAAQQAQFGGPI